MEKTSESLTRVQIPAGACFPFSRFSLKFLGRRKKITRRVGLKLKDMRIGITGSPGTGKKTIGRLLSEKTQFTLLSISDYAIKAGLAKLSYGEFVVDTQLLKNKIGTREKIIVGHLLPYVVPDKDLDLIIVLRTSPIILRKRYLERRYSEKKIRENVEAEMIGLISSECASVYQRKKLAEFDTSRATQTAIVRNVLDIINGRKEPTFGTIDWLYGLKASTLEQTLRGKCNRFNRPKRITRFANPKARKSRYYSDTR